MGARSQTETLARILFAFVKQTTWTQSDLAAYVGVQTRTVREHLTSLADAGVPLERDKEHPRVYWSVPNGWFPGGAILSEHQLEIVARLVAREPKSDERERILRALLKQVDASLQPSVERLGVAHEDLCVFEDALNGSVVEMRYFSASRGDSATRSVSVHRILYSVRPSIVATCHRDRTLKWFRLDRASNPKLDSDGSFIDAAEADVDDFIRTSFDGFRSRSDAIDVRFRAKWPEARWFVREIDDATLQTTLQTAEDFVLVEVRTAAIEALARRLVGLGDLITAETEELRQAIVDLAKGALTTNEDPAR